MFKALLVLAVLLWPAAQPASAEPLTGPWEVTYTPDEQHPQVFSDGHGAYYAIENWCVVKHYATGPIQSRWCTAPRGGPLNAAYIRGVRKGLIWIVRMGVDGFYRYTYDGKFVDIVNVGGEIVGSAIGRKVFVFGDDGQTRLMNEGGQVLAEWPEKLTVGPTDSRSGTYVFSAAGPLRRVMPNGESTTFGEGDIAQTGYVLVDRHDNVFVADVGASVVRIFSSDGKQLQTIGSGQLRDIGTLALGSDGTVFVADGGNNRIQQFTVAGALVKAYGEPGTFTTPTEVHYDPEGYLLVTEANGRMQRMRVLQPQFSSYQWPDQSARGV